MPRGTGPGTPSAGRRTPQREVSLTDYAAAAGATDEFAEVRSACRGDEAAFERLYRRHVGRIHGLARRLADVREADDITQDVFVRAWERLGTFRGAATFGTWLHRLAVNVIMERHRAAFRRAARISDDPMLLERAPAPRVDAAFPIDFEAAVERLPPGARQVFVLHDVEGYQHHEIGRLMGIAVGTSKGQLHRARTILRRRLGAAGDPPGTPASGGER